MALALVGHLTFIQVTLKGAVGQTDCSWPDILSPETFNFCLASSDPLALQDLACAVDVLFASCCQCTPGNTPPNPSFSIHLQRQATWSIPSWCLTYNTCDPFELETSTTFRPPLFAVTPTTVFFNRVHLTCASIRWKMRVKICADREAFPTNPPVSEPHRLFWQLHPQSGLAHHKRLISSAQLLF